MKSRFYSLDALRGIAAMAVYFHHSDALSFPIPAKAAYRAVDLFFILSGFVLAYAYDNQLQSGLSTRKFMQFRLIRLYPLYFVGAVLGSGGAILALILHGGHFTALTVAMGSLTVLLMLPTIPTSDNNSLVPMNGPGWSLLFELFINFFYAITARFLTKTVLTALVCVFGIWLVVAARVQGTTDGGINWIEANCGLARVSFSFTAGILLQKTLPRRQHVHPLAWIIPVACIPAFVLLPRNLYVDLLCVIGIFPALIALGKTFEVPDKTAAAFLGNLSYPLYIVHVPCIMLTYKVFSYLKSDANRYAPYVGLGLFVGLAFFCYVLDRYYDLPVRRRLMVRLHERKVVDSRH